MPSSPSMSPSPSPFSTRRAFLQCQVLPFLKDLTALHCHQSSSPPSSQAPEAPNHLVPPSITPLAASANEVQSNFVSAPALLPIAAVAVAADVAVVAVVIIFFIGWVLRPGRVFREKPLTECRMPHATPQVVDQTVNLPLVLLSIQRLSAFMYIDGNWLVSRPADRQTSASSPGPTQ